MAKQAVKYGHSIDLQKNQLINVVIDQLAAAPAAPKGGMIYYDTTDSAMKYWDGTEWIIIGQVEDGEGLSKSDLGKIRTLDVNVDDVTIEISDDAVAIKEQGVSTRELKDENVTTIKLADKAVTFVKIQDLTAMTVIGSIPGGTPHEIQLLNEEDLGSDSPTALATQHSIKAYIDNLIADIGNLQGGFDAGASAVMPGDAETNNGDYWYVTGPGEVLGEAFNIGDLIIANQDAPDTGNINHYIRLESNRTQATTTLLGLLKIATNAMMDVNVMVDDTTAVTPAKLQRIQATEEKKGIAEIATQAETDAGLDDTRMITPLKLKAWYDAKAGGFAANIGNGAAVSFAVAHGLNSKDVHVEIFENATGETIMTNITRTDVNTVTVAYGVDNAPGANAHRVLIKKVA